MSDLLLPQKGSRCTYQVSSNKGLAEPREGKVLGIKQTARGAWVEIKDLKTGRLMKARPGLVSILP